MLPTSEQTGNSKWHKLGKQCVQSSENVWKEVNGF